ncbi:outer membrane beta-barrel protein [Aurantimonas marianensis]|uniref:Outer membrane beta-barrel protein n=1 Tax=Aurantimonas marianensis TaxID=2920428 RepID=A0A9X2H5I4_9HYPH|nr:outer membrane beta-barrel protein [Aurantimonas marianensis]MCP3054208.1 outer membrane beta-barrel protein [Aurantimonas marianensis]
MTTATAALGLASPFLSGLCPMAAFGQTLSMPELRTDGELLGSRGLDGLRTDTRTLSNASGDLSAQDPAQRPRDRPLLDEAPAREPPTPAREFDLFSGPDIKADALDVTIGQSRATKPVPAANPRSDPVDARDTGEIRRDERRRQNSRPSTGLPPGNPPLAAGVAGEALPADSSLRTNRPTEAIGRIVRRGEDDPFAPVGIRAGRFILYPELLQTLGTSTNSDQIPGGEGGAFSETTVSARLLSDWSQDEAELNSRLTFRRNFSGETRDDPEAAVDGRWRFDLDRLTTATLRGAVAYRREDAGEIDAALRNSDRPEILTASTSAQLQRDFGRLRMTGTGTAAREAYYGQPAGFRDQSYTTLTAGLRAGYELSPALSPFIEGSVGWRLFDDSSIRGPNDVGRDSLLPSLRAGLMLDLAEKLTGEIAAGYAWNLPDDPAAETTGTPTLDANLVWSPRRGTDVNFAARTAFEPETAGTSTTTSYTGSLGLRHVLTARADLTAALTAEYSDSTLPREDEIALTGETGITYWFNRTLAFTGLYSHQEVYSDADDGDYSADTIRLGLKLQR